MKSEHDIQSEIMVAVSKHDCTIIRTNVGKIKTADGRWFIAGPPQGWPDLTGFSHKTGQIILLEIKNKRGRLRPDQKHFAKFVKQFPYVIYGVARSAEDAIKIIDEGTKMKK